MTKEVLGTTVAGAGVEHSQGSGVAVHFHIDSVELKNMATKSGFNILAHILVGEPHYIWKQQ